MPVKPLQPEIEINRFSAHKFSAANASSELGYLPFSAVKYSKFKFGCKDSAREFGQELAWKFINSTEGQNVIIIAQTLKLPIVVLSSPYEHVPTATAAMKDYFIRCFNSALREQEVSPVLEAKIYRSCSYQQDYGCLSSKERRNLIGNDSFYVDANFLKDKINIFLDDVYITGAHESTMVRMLMACGVLNKNTAHNYFLYFAELANPHANPAIENTLNYFYVKNLVCLDKIIKNEAFILNTRVVKYILNAAMDECATFLNYQTNSFLHTLYHAAIGNRYHKIPEYTHNLNYLKYLVDENG